ncbi:DnaD domain protein [Tepidibacillus sp. HK-1]|uniref:DnaD domain protein n=1 Tax=Tepidibacillus sp. HK-1 TaxID=1883407 RepID=UPI000852CC99|nr:DnaD domain protein [Tepidibacillus sp. HK-1]GBF12169.1 DNA replication protein DnaD [Tepidibacillus sp. HK-1]
MILKHELFLSILQEGTTPIFNQLLSNYKKIGLSDQEMMLIIHILYFQSKGKLFPSISELEQRMALKTEELVRILQRLVKQGYLQIDEMKDETSGILYETYNLTPFYLKIIDHFEREMQMDRIEKKKSEKELKENNLFKVFEQEFGRPLSPMEVELISAWLDQDHYSNEIILYALKEAVFSNKLNFRYIDKILFEWQKKNLKTVEQIKEHTKQFRVNQDQSTIRHTKKNGNEKFEFYNWLENDS